MRVRLSSRRFACDWAWRRHGHEFPSKALGRGTNISRADGTDDRGKEGPGGAVTRLVSNHML